MNAATLAHDAFAPPPPPGRARAVVLAVLAHLLLIAALTWGVNWKISADQPAVEAELWAAVPQQAAPRAVAPPEPAPAPEPKPQPAPPPPRPAQDDAREADIALQKKKNEEQEKKRLAQLEQERKDKLLKEKLEKEKRDKAQHEKEQREKQLAEQKKLEQQKAEQQKKLAEEKRKAQAEEKRAEELRKDQLRRIAGLAGATGGENATGQAQRSAGPSGSYGGKVAAKVKPNIVYPDTVAGNPRAEVEVRAAPDGTIVSARITQSSGNKAWDDAVVRALYKTETLPHDIDGRVPSSLVIGFRPKD